MGSLLRFSSSEENKKYRKLILDYKKGQEEWKKQQLLTTIQSLNKTGKAISYREICQRTGLSRRFVRKYYKA